VVIGASDGALATLGTGRRPPGLRRRVARHQRALRLVVPRPVADPTGRLFCYALTEGHWVSAAR
jgi:gluconokinase